MTYDTRIARAFGMSDAVWLRHANPWSGLTRFPILPLVVLAVWARAWLGWWCLVPIGTLVVWAWVNPRAFARPRAYDHWMSRAVLGERVWIARRAHPIPRHHAVAAHLLSGVSAVGAPILIYGVWALAVWPTLMGLAVILLGKLWFLDRMVWLCDDTRRVAPDAFAWMDAASQADGPG